MPTVHRSNPNRYFNPEDEVFNAYQFKRFRKTNSRRQRVENEPERGLYRLGQSRWDVMAPGVMARGVMARGVMARGVMARGVMARLHSARVAACPAARADASNSGLRSRVSVKHDTTVTSNAAAT
jgi:hypothetical protein